MNRKSMSRVLAAGVIAAVAGLPLTSAAQPDNAPPHDPPPMEAPLGGPSVRDREVPGAAPRFGDDAEGQRRRMAERIPPRVMRQAMAAIMDDDAPEDLRATPEQRERIQGYGREFEQQLREYVEQHRAELQELRGRIPESAMAGPAAEIFRRLDEPGARAGDGATGPGPGARERRRAAAGDGGPEQGAGKARRAAEDIPVEVRERLRELASGAPAFDQVYTKIWAELRPEQQQAVNARLDEFRQRQARQREDEYVNKRVGERGRAPGAGPDERAAPSPQRRRAPDGARPAPGGPGGPEARRPGSGPQGPEGRGPRDGDRPDRAQRRDRLVRLFEQLTPEQQEQLLQRLEARARDGDGGPPSPRNRRPADRPPQPAPGEPRPMPEMNDVPTPPPPPPQGMDDERPRRSRPD